MKLFEVFLFSAALLISVSSGVSGECEEGKWAECRQDLVQAIFNQSTVPSRKPDYILVSGSHRYNQHTTVELFHAQLPKVTCVSVTSNAA